MKKLLTLLLVLCTVAISASAQDFYGNCTVPKFGYVYGYAQPGGGGAEVGLWPQDDLIGGGMGMAFSTYTEYTTKASGEVVATKIGSHLMYATGMARISRFVYPVARIGVYDLNSIYMAVGIRLAVPLQVGRTTNCALIAEPLYTNRGLSGTGGMGIAF